MTAFNEQGGDLAVSIGGVYYFADASSVETWDRKRQRAEMATGNRNNTVDFYDGDSEVKCHISKMLGSSDGSVLFPILGLGATIGLPTSTTIIYNSPNRMITCANALCNTVEIEGERGKPWMLNADFLCTSLPTIALGYQSSRPSFQAQPNYLYWRDLLTFFSAAASGTNCTKFSIKVEHNLDPFPGVRADGTTIPTVYTPTEVYVTGTFTMQLLNNADYTLFLAACDTAADLGITATPFCAVSTTLTITCKLAVYETQKTNRVLKKTTLEDYSYVSKALGGVNQAVCTLA